MKILNKLTLFVFVALLSACGSDYDPADVATLQELPGYVAFDAQGTSINAESVTVGETAGSASVTIENPTGTLSDITITYQLSGTAVEGVDYTIDGVNGTSGTIVLQENNDGDIQNNNNVDLVVNILDDDDVDGQKTLTITLVSASNAEGTVAVGRGGTDFLKETTITINDDDCPNLAGNYSVTTTYAQHDFIADGYTENTMEMEVVEVSPAVYMVADASGGLYSTGPYADSYGTTGLPFTFSGGCGVISWSDQVDPFGQPLLPVADMPSSVDDDTGVITITIFGETYAELWTSVYTPL